MHVRSCSGTVAGLLALQYFKYSNLLVAVRFEVSPPCFSTIFNRKADIRHNGELHNSWSRQVPDRHFMRSPVTAQLYSYQESLRFPQYTTASKCCCGASFLSLWQSVCVAQVQTQPAAIDVVLLSALSRRPDYFVYWSTVSSTTFCELWHAPNALPLCQWGTAFSLWW